MINQLMLLLVCLLSFTACTIRTDPGEGRKIGRVVRFSRQGMLFKTWEGELIRGGLNDGTGSLGGPFYFTVENGALVDEIIMAFEQGKEVILYYDCEFISFIGRSEHLEPYFVKKVMVLE